MSAKGRIIRLLSSLVLERATVIEAREAGGFRRLRLEGRVPSFAAGAKVQLLLPGDDMRTYTPVAAPDGMVLLGWMQAGGPGARFMAQVRVGDELRFVGPQRSLDLPPGPVVLVGDETSVAVAAALAAERPGQVRAIVQAGPRADVPAAAATVSLHAVEVVAAGDTEATVARVGAALSALPGAKVALTGGSPLVLAVREGLRRAGTRDVKSKTYWIPGKSGLD